MAGWKAPARAAAKPVAPRPTQHAQGKKAVAQHTPPPKAHPKPGGVTGTGHRTPVHNPVRAIPSHVPPHRVIGTVIGSIQWETPSPLGNNMGGRPGNVFEALAPHQAPPKHGKLVVAQKGKRGERGETWVFPIMGGGGHAFGDLMVGVQPFNGGEAYASTAPFGGYGHGGVTPHFDPLAGLNFGGNDQEAFGIFGAAYPAAYGAIGLPGMAAGELFNTQLSPSDYGFGSVLYSAGGGPLGFSLASQDFSGDMATTFGNATGPGGWAIGGTDTGGGV